MGQREGVNLVIKGSDGSHHVTMTSDSVSSEGAGVKLQLGQANRTS